MIDLEACRARVRGITLASSPLFKSVSDALSAADAINNFDAIVPAAYVYTGTESAGKNLYAASSRLQSVATRVNVLFVLGAQRADGERADPVEITRGLVIANMTGWTPPGASKPFDYASYSLRELRDGLIWCECLFVSGWTLTGPS